ncbi:MAG: BrnA antitoxin family protein [Alphaproteobacteria bacterium]|nr:BrnA antitoxin family protein [Alphaproteobacteria bacterium]
MTASDDTRQFSAETLKAERARGETRTRADAPARAVDEDFWRNARVVMPPPGKTSVHLRLDADVLDWFRGQGKGHLSRMNAVLRSFMEAHKR